MSVIDDGGPAFAAPGMPAYSPDGLPLNPWAGHGWAHDPQPGMSLRDWLAKEGARMHAEGLLALGVQPSSRWDEIAAEGLRFADAMLAARKPASASESNCAIAHDAKNSANFRKEGNCIVCGSDWPATTP